MLLTSLPDLDAIELSLEGNSFETALRNLFEAVRVFPDVKDPDQAWRDVIARLGAGSVALDQDIAVPHARTVGVERTVVAVGRHGQGVAVDEKNRQVRLLFLILTTKTKPAEYLQILAALATRLRNSQVRRALLGATSPAEFAAALKT